MTEDCRQGVVLCHPKLSYAELARLLCERVPDRQKAWYLVSSVTDICLGKFDKARVEELVNEWPQGRVFCEVCEIRWHRSSNMEHNKVLLLSEDARLQLDGFRPLGEGWRVLEPGKATLKAWGSPLSSTAEATVWGETRLPKRLRYPPDCVKGDIRYVYCCNSAGTVQFLRLVGME